MPVKRQHGVLINRSREYGATHRVVMTHTHTHYRKTEKIRVLHGEDSTVVSTVNDSERE